MAEPFIGQVSIAAYQFAPRFWSNCDGQILAIDQNHALYAILGNQFGGNARSTYGLPDLRGRTPIGAGQLITDYSQEMFYPGLKVGAEEVTLLPSQMPFHTHSYLAEEDDSLSGTVPGDGDVLAAERPGGGQATPVYGAHENLVAMAPGIVSTVGGGQSHNNLQPSLVVRYIIAMEGIFPARN